MHQNGAAAAIPLHCPVGATPVRGATARPSHPADSSAASPAPSVQSPLRATPAPSATPARRAGPGAAPTRPRTRPQSGTAAGGRKVLILGGDTDNNLGDHAILAALCHQLTRIDPGVAITVVSADADRAAMPGVVDVLRPGVRGLPRLLRAARAQDLVLIGGGGLFQDDDSRVKMPYWAARLALLRRANPRIHAHALGAGPLRHRESRRLAGHACRTLQSVSVRDPFAHEWLAPLSTTDVRVVPDAAFMLPPADAEVADGHLQRIGIPSRSVIGRQHFSAVPSRSSASEGLPAGARCRRLALASWGGRDEPGRRR